MKLNMGYAGIGIALLLSGQAEAQQDGATEKGEASVGIEEVVVTARRRVENLESIPDSIQVLGADKISDSGLRGVGDVTRHVSNFTLVEAQQPGVVLINIRGVGQVRNGEAPVAVVIDGVQQNSPNQITQDLYDVERIEVLKGPQGALYGRNAIGGAINIVTKAPGNEFEGKVRLGYADGDEYTGGFVFSGPIVEDELLFRISGQYTDREGQIDNITLDEKVDYNETWNARVNLLYTPSDVFAVDVRGWTQRQEAGAAWYVPGPVNSDPEEAIGNLMGLGERDLDDYSVKIEYDLGEMSLTSITAFSKVSSFIFEELDWLPLDFLSATQALDVEAWSQELRLSSNNNSGLRWMIGAYYLDMDRDLDTEILLRPDLTGVPFPIPLPATRSTDNNETWAVFGQVDIPLNDRWLLTGALRYDKDSRHQRDRNPLVPGIPSKFSKTFTSLQPKVSLAYTFEGGSMGYFTAAKGFRSGGFNPNDVVTRLFDKEELWNYELGFKTSSDDRRLILNGAVFYTDIDDRQVYGLDLSVGPNQFIANPIPESHIVGAELELMARPFPNLDLSLGIGVLDSEIDDYDTMVFANTLANGDFEGNELNQTPSYTVNAAVQYSWPLSSGALFSVRLDVSGMGGDYYWEIANKDKRDSLWIGDLRLNYQRDHLDVALFARNVFDERYEVEFVPVEFSAAISGDLAAPSRPRQVGIDVTWNF